MSKRFVSTYLRDDFDIDNVDGYDYQIDEIAHHLSMLCRFNGALSSYYSVAEHSIHVATLLPPELKMAGLLHDAAEAYIGDIVSPIKDRICLKDVKNTINIADLEDKILRAIFKKLSVKWPGKRDAKLISRADAAMCQYEWDNDVGSLAPWISDRDRDVNRMVLKDFGGLHKYNNVDAEDQYLLAYELFAC